MTGRNNDYDNVRPNQELTAIKLARLVEFPNSVVVEIIEADPPHDLCQLRICNRRAGGCRDTTRERLDGAADRKGQKIVAVADEIWRAEIDQIGDSVAGRR